MSSISAGTSTGTALVSTGDTTGALVFKTGASATTAMTIGADQSVTFAGSTNILINTFNIQSSAASITLTTSSAGFQVLSFTGSGLSTILPAATAYSSNGQKFVIRNAGTNAFTIKNAAGNIIYWVKPNAVAQVWLKNTTGTTANWEIFTGDIETDNGLAWLGTKILALQNNITGQGTNSSLSAMLAPDLFYFQYFTGSVYRAYIAQEIAENQWASAASAAAGIAPSGDVSGKGTVVDGTSFYWGSPAGTDAYLVTAQRAVGTGSPSLSLTNTLTLTGLNNSFTMYSHSNSLQIAAGLIPTSFNPGVCVVSGVGAGATVTSAQSIALGTNASTTKRTDAIMFDANNGLLCMYDNVLQTHYFKLFNLSGTTITYVGTTRTVVNAFTSYSNPNLRIARISDTEALYYYEKTSSPFTKIAVKISFDAGTNDISITSYNLTSTYNNTSDFSGTSVALAYYIFNKGMVIVFSAGAKVFLQKLTLVNGIPTLSGAMRTDFQELIENTDAINQALNSKCDAFALRYTEEPQANKWVYFFRTLLVNDKD